MWLFVGLGNPGQKYENTRHNIGFMAVDAIVRRHSFSAWSKKFQGEVATGELNGQKVLALKPQTFMNLSGTSVQAAMAFYKIAPENIVVFYDELDLIPGKSRAKKGGGSGGHNGIKSIDQNIGSDYWRVRLGIGHPGRPEMVSSYVLHPFEKNDAAWLEKLLDEVAREAPLIIENKIDLMMTRVAEAMRPLIGPKETKEETKEQGHGI